MDCPRRPDASAPAGLDGRLGPLLRDPRDQRGPGAERHPAAVDLRHLRVRARRTADDDGLPRRPHRPPQAPPHRRRRLRHGLGHGRLRRQRRDADRGPRGCDRRHLDAVDHRDHPHDVHRPRAAREGDRSVVRRHDRRHRARFGDERRPRRVLLVGLGLPRQPARDGAAAGPRPDPAPRVQEPGTGPFRPAQRAAVDDPPCCPSSTA